MVNTTQGCDTSDFENSVNIINSFLQWNVSEYARRRNRILFVFEATLFSSDEQLFMASSDVSSLFTNVPVQVCADLVFENSDYRYCQ